MSSLQAKERILFAADQLFQQKGYDQVTVREIAKQANCSHTSIYVYYKDKKELFGQLVRGPLLELLQKIQAIIDNGSEPRRQLQEVAHSYVEYGLSHRHLYQTIMTLDAGRVDEPGSEWEISKLRMQLFQLLQKVVMKVIGSDHMKQTLAFSRMVFFQLHGTITSYSHTPEAVATIKERVLPLVSTSIHYLILGVMNDEANTDFTAHI